MRKRSWAPTLAGGLWIVFGLIVGTERYISIKSEAPAAIRISFSRYLAWQTAQWTVWALLTPLVVWGARRVPLAFRWRPIALHTALGLAVAVAGTAAGLLATLWFNPLSLQGQGSLPQSYLALLSSSGPIDFLLYWAIVGCTCGYDFRGQLEERELQAAVMRGELNLAHLENLRIQLQPHFLFNTLHAISGMVREGNSEGAVSMIAGLSDLLRAALDTVDRPTVSLAEEMDLLKLYLEIQQVRFCDRLEYRTHLDPSALDARVPSLLLQPLVENSILHGLARAGRGRLEIQGWRESGQLVIEVKNDGSRLSPDWRDHEGVGLKTTRERLRTLYGPEGKLSLQDLATGGVVARVCIPCPGGG